MRVDLGQQPATVRKETSHESANEASNPPNPGRRALERLGPSFTKLPDNIDHILLFFSGGKDSIVSADLLRKHFRGKITWLYLYFVKGLQVIEPTLAYYSRAWGVEIHQRPCHETLALLAKREGKRKKLYSIGDIEKRYREEFEVEWICTGYRRDESLSRRGAMAKAPEGIDLKYKKIYPVANFSAKQILAYCKLYKFPLPLTYSLGAERSVWVPDANQLIWLRSYFPGDYTRIVSAFPELGDAVFKKTGEV